MFQNHKKELFSICMLVKKKCDQIFWQYTYHSTYCVLNTYGFNKFNEMV